MIIQVLLWIVEAVLFLLYGRFVLRILRPVGEFKTSFTLTFLTGLVVLTSLASILSLVMRLSFESLLIISGGGALILFNEWRLDRLKDLKAQFSFPISGKVWLFIGLVLFGLILDLSTRRAANPDTGIYHAQAIHWIELYPAVPGLGNLHTRFAFNSSWLVINAFFSFAFTGIQSFHALPGLLVCVFSLEALRSTRKIYQHELPFFRLGESSIITIGILHDYHRIFVSWNGSACDFASLVCSSGMDGGARAARDCNSSPTGYWNCGNICDYSEVIGCSDSAFCGNHLFPTPA